MTTIREECKIVGDSAYWGERGEWEIVKAMHRDSPLLDHHNFDTMLERLGGESDTVGIEHFSHWAVGWVDYLVIDPTDTHHLEQARDMRAQLEDYPILDEDKYSEKEWEAAREYWASLSVRERVELCQRFYINPFAARHEYIPEQDNGSLFDYLSQD